MFNSYLTAHKDCLIFLDPENAQRKCSSVVIFFEKESDKIAIEHPGVTIEACKVAKMEGYTGEARVRRWFRVWQLCGGGEVSSHHTTTGDSILQQPWNIQCFVKKWILTAFSPASPSPGRVRLLMHQSGRLVTTPRNPRAADSGWISTCRGSGAVNGTSRNIEILPG